jgi:NAD(P)H-hydrate epimerase
MTVCLRPLSRQEVRHLDEEASAGLGLPTLILMENAGRGAAGWLAELVGAMPPDAGGRPFLPPPSSHTNFEPRGPALPMVLVLCGPGNNGGDGAVVARHLNAWGFSVRVVWFTRSAQLRGDAATQWAILKKSGIEQSAWFDTRAEDSMLDVAELASILTDHDWLVDGLLGTGLSRPVEGPFRTVIETLNSAGKPIFALDVPSGLDADTGQPLGVAVRAIATATFVAAKQGFLAPGATDYTGEIAIIDIGVPRCLLLPFLWKNPAVKTN